MASAHKLKVLATARLSDYKLNTKLTGLLENERIGNVSLVRRFPLHPGHPKLENINPRGVFAAVGLLYEFWRLWILWRLSAREIDLLIGIQLVLHGVQAAFVGRLRKIPVVLSVIGSDVYVHLASRWKRPLLAWALRGASAVTVMGPVSRRRISENGLCLARVFEIQNFQDPERFQPRSKTPRYDFIFVGNLIPLKRVDALLAAVAEVKSTVPDVKIVVLGDGPEHRGLVAKARELELEAHVDFVGRQRSVETYLNASRVLVLASKSEALPAVAIEAMYCGIPSVLTSVGDIPGFFEHYKNALLVPPGDHEALVAALCRILTEPALYGRLCEGALAARARHMKRWGIKGQVRRWNQILDAAGLSDAPFS